jgi:hypothetical protein
LTIVPTAGEIDHVTDVLDEPVTKPVNCWVCAAESVVDAGETLTPTVGDNDTVAHATLAESAALMAVTNAVCAVVILEGAL